MKLNESGLESELLPLFRRHCIITTANNLIDANGFNLREVRGRSYKIFSPVFPEEKVELERALDTGFPVYLHMLGVRMETFDIIGEEYLFIRAYRVGHTLKLETIVIVVEAQVKGGCYLIDDDGHIGGDGEGRWHAVLCPPEAESELVNDLRAEEAKRRKSLPKMMYMRCESPYDSIPKEEL
jgi:hypothetical protein